MEQTSTCEWSVKISSGEGKEGSLSSLQQAPQPSTQRHEGSLFSPKPTLLCLCFLSVLTVGVCRGRRAAELTVATRSGRRAAGITAIGNGSVRVAVAEDMITDLLQLSCLISGGQIINYWIMIRLYVLSILNAI